MSIDQIYDGLHYKELLQDARQAEQCILQLFLQCEKNGFVDWLKNEIYREGSEYQQDTYPSQGLVYTSYERDKLGEPQRGKISDDVLGRTIQAWLYYLLLDNHDERLEALFQQSAHSFIAPQAASNIVFDQAREHQQAITIADIKLEVQGWENSRQSRTAIHQSGPFVSYFHPESDTPYPGRKQARSVIAVGANPEITGSPFALSTIAQAHSLVCIPRDGYFSDVKRQADLARLAIEYLENSPTLYRKDQALREKLLDFYIHNLVGVIEPESSKAVARAKALYEVGVRTFRIYSPEPGSDSLKTLQALRKVEKDLGWEPIEIFVGQVVSVEQAIALEQAGADAIYVGIGGGGRCITGVVGGLTINWPQLVWELRGKIHIPIIVEGGANDSIAESLAIGASGIGAVGKLAGTIENPGGNSFFIDEIGNFFRYYGGEASDRMRAMAGRVGPFGFILNTEGETTRKALRYGAGELPTLLQVLHILNQGVVAGMVFQNTSTLSEFQRNAVRSIMLASPNDDASRHTH